MKKKYVSALLFCVLFNSVFSQVTTFYPFGSIDIVVHEDYLYFISGNYEIKRADISDPLFASPPSTLIFDADQPGFDGGELVISLGITGSDLYFTVASFLTNNRIYKLDLTHLDLDPVLVYTDIGHWIEDLGFYEEWLYPTGLGYYGGYRNLSKLNTLTSLPTTPSLVEDRQTSALTVSGNSMYFSESVYTGTYTNGEIFFKNLFFDSPEVSKFIAVGRVHDLLFFEGLLYFTDDEGLKRINPIEAIPTSELLMANTDYENLKKIQVKAYGTGEKFLFINGQEGGLGRIFKLDLNAPTLSINNTVANTSFVYPNPTSHKVSIKTTSHIKRISVYNLLGKRVFEITNNNKTLEYKLDVSSFNSGIYNLQIETTLGIEMKKIIKQ